MTNSVFFLLFTTLSTLTLGNELRHRDLHFGHDDHQHHDHENGFTRGFGHGPHGHGFGHGPHGFGDHDHDHGRGFSQGSMKLEAGMKCEGGFERKDGARAGHKCQGGSKMEFEASMKPPMMGGAIAQQLQKQADELKPETHEFFPPREVLEEMMKFEMSQHGSHDEMGEGVNTMREAEFVDEERTFQYGGLSHMRWGCNVTMAMKDGNFTKTASCGFMSFKGEGMNKPDFDFDFDE